MAEYAYTKEQLKHLQSLPLEEKVQITIGRIIQWYNYWNGDVYVSFSGGKDSTVLLHLVRSIYPDVPAVFSNTGLEYPEIQKSLRWTMWPWQPGTLRKSGNFPVVPSPRGAWWICI